MKAPNIAHMLTSDDRKLHINNIVQYTIADCVTRLLITTFVTIALFILYNIQSILWKHKRLD
jgi:hypothetical protein